MNLLFLAGFLAQIAVFQGPAAPAPAPVVVGPIASRDPVWDVKFYGNEVGQWMTVCSEQAGAPLGGSPYDPANCFIIVGPDVRPVICRVGDQWVVTFRRRHHP